MRLPFLYFNCPAFCLLNLSNGHQLGFELGNVVVEFLFEGDALVNQTAGVKNGCVGATEACTDCFEGHLSVLLSKIHHHLACIRHLALTRLGENLVNVDVVELADGAGD